MTLENLAGRTLERIETDTLTIKKLLDAAERNIQDAKTDSISNETRFDAAYKAVMQIANAALQCSGYRTLTSRPGHHQTMIQTLPLTIGLDTDRMIVLDELRKQRNVADYSGDLIPDGAVAECFSQAEYLRTLFSDWMEQEHPELTS